MDEFTAYGNTFQEALDNLKRSWSDVKKRIYLLVMKNVKILLIEGIVLGHHVSSQGIKVDPAKIEVIVGLPSPKK